MLSAAAIRQSSQADIVERWFFTAVAGAILAVAIAGFMPSLVFSSSRRAPVSLLVATHGALFFLWLGIFFIQARLIADRRVRLHMRVGWAAAFVAGLMIPLGFATCIEMVRRGFDLSGDLHADHDPASVALFPLADTLIFSVLLAVGIILRRRTEVHRTLMLFANIALVPAPLAHLIGHVPRLASIRAPIILLPISLFFVAAIARDFLVKRTVRPLTCGLAAAMLLSGPLRAVVIGPSPCWHHFVYWLAR